MSFASPDPCTIQLTNLWAKEHKPGLLLPVALLLLSSKRLATSTHTRNAPVSKINFYMAEKVNLRQLISFASFGAGHIMGVIQSSAKTVQSSESKIFPFVVLLPKSAFATAISLWNELVKDRITRIFIGTRRGSLWAMKEIEFWWNILLGTIPSEGSPAPGPCVWEHTETPVGHALADSITVGITWVRAVTAMASWLKRYVIGDLKSLVRIMIVITH